MIDWDDVCDPAVGDGSVPEAVQEWVQRLGTYTEVSPSGTGLKQLLEVGDGIPDLLDDYNHKNKLGLDPVGNLDEDPHLEVYTENHYTTVTGDLFAPPTADQRFSSLDQADQTVSDLLEEYLSPSTAGNQKTAPPSTEQNSAQTASSSGITSIGKKSAEQWCGGTNKEEIPGVWVSVEGTPTVDQVWATGCALSDDFRSLWNGEVAGYDTVSEADNALVSRLWYYCDNRELVIKTFEESGLYGIRTRRPDLSDWSKSYPKWDKDSYRRNTLSSTEDNRWPSHDGHYLDPSQTK
ncbi:hypothetical protein [Natronoarchaeum mannanilyticum]